MKNIDNKKMFLEKVDDLLDFFAFQKKPQLNYLAF